jgi:hypothetical protein
VILVSAIEPIEKEKRGIGRLFTKFIQMIIPSDFNFIWRYLYE